METIIIDVPRPRNHRAKAKAAIGPVVAFGLVAATLFGVSYSFTQQDEETSKEISIATSVHSDVMTTAEAVHAYIEQNPDISDVRVVMPEVTGSNKVVAFGTAADFTVCGYNEAGSTNYFKYSSVTGEVVGANGSEAGLCGEQSQTPTAGPDIVAGSSTPVSTDHSVTSVSGSGGALASSDEVTR